jgi:putative RNA 2'-phosphotransferase
MASTQDLTELSKLLAVMLRHDPSAFGLSLDSEGYAQVEAVWAQICHHYPTRYTYDDLLRLVAGDDSGETRYEIVDTRIRALFGHSKVAVTYSPAEPPELLYHGTTSEALPLIQRDGLLAQQRQYVHLTVRRERALTVAQRHAGRAILLIIRAGEAHRAGIVFYHPESEHYLAKAIPAVFIDFAAQPS